MAEEKEPAGTPAPAKPPEPRLHVFTKGETLPSITVSVPMPPVKPPAQQAPQAPAPQAKPQAPASSPASPPKASDGAK